MEFKKFYENYNEIDIDWYHGTTHEIKSFTDDFVGQGHDQEGPGIYFTSNYEDSAGYSRKSENQGSIFTVKLNFRKLVPLTGKHKVKEYIQLIEWADDYIEKLMDWGNENTSLNMKMVLNSLQKEESPKAAFLSIWYDFYRNNPVDYVRNMVSLGYDGFVVNKSFMNTKHAIVYNPKIIKVIDKH